MKILCIHFSNFSILNRFGIESRTPLNLLHEEYSIMSVFYIWPQSEVNIHTHMYWFSAHTHDWHALQSLPHCYKALWVRQLPYFVVINNNLAIGPLKWHWKKKKTLKPGHLHSSQGLMGIGQPWIQNWTLQACHIYEGTNDWSFTRQ